MNLIILGLDFLANVDAIIKVRSRKITIFDKDFSYLENSEEFDTPRLCSDLLRMQFSLQIKNITNQDLLRRILFNIHTNPSEAKYRALKKQALSDQLIKSLSILGFRDSGSHIVLDNPSVETINFALQVVCN